MATAKKKADGTLIYRDKPLIRSGNTLYYGDMKDEYIVMLQILDSKPVGDLQVASRVMVTLMRTDEKLNPIERIAKTGEKDGIYSAIEIAEIWLERALAAK